MGEDRNEVQSSQPLLNISDISMGLNTQSQTSISRKLMIYRIKEIKRKNAPSNEMKATASIMLYAGKNDL